MGVGRVESPLPHNNTPPPLQMLQFSSKCFHQLTDMDIPPVPSAVERLQNTSILKTVMIKLCIKIKLITHKAFLPKVVSFFNYYIALNLCAPYPPLKKNP